MKASLGEEMDAETMQFLSTLEHEIECRNDSD